MCDCVLAVWSVSGVPVAVIVIEWRTGVSVSDFNKIVFPIVRGLSF